MEKTEIGCRMRQLQTFSMPGNVHVNQARPFPQSSFRAAALEDPGAAR
jgi:hypothetical protein